MSRKTVLAISAVFVAFISLPILLLVIGQRGALDQNRQATDIASPTLDSIGDASWFSGIEKAFEDRMPLRPEAVTVDAWIDVTLLDDSPSDLVVAGNDGWLFLSKSVEQPCPGTKVGPMVLAEFAEARYITESVGKNLVIGFAPDKAAVYPDQVGVDVRCVLDTAEMFDQSPIIVSSLDRLRSGVRDGSLYYKLDTHWSALGSSYLAESLVEELRPGLWSPMSLVSVGADENEGDLTRMQGLPRTETVIDYRTVREGAVVTVDRVDTAFRDGSLVDGLQTITFSTAGVPVIKGNTLVLHDSFGWALIKTVAQYFGDVTFINKRDPGLSYTVPLAQSADTIVLEFVQRATYQQFVSKPISEAFAVAFSDQAVDTTQATVVPDDGVSLSSDSDHRYAFFESTTDGVPACQLRIDGRENVRIDRNRPIVAIRIIGAVDVSSNCAGSVVYWEGSFARSG